MDIATARTFDNDEDLRAVTLCGPSKDVMDVSMERTLRRAAARGQTVANGGVYIFENKEAEKYDEEDLNKLRPFGFEKIVFAKGELMLLIQLLLTADIVHELLQVRSTLLQVEVLGLTFAEQLGVRDLGHSLCVEI